MVYEFGVMVASRKEFVLLTLDVRRVIWVDVFGGHSAIGIKAAERAVVCLRLDLDAVVSFSEFLVEDPLHDVVFMKSYALWSSS